MWPTRSGTLLFKVSSLLEVELVVERNLFDVRNNRCACRGLGPLLSELQCGDLVAVLLGQQEASFGKGCHPALHSRKNRSKSIFVEIGVIRYLSAI